MIHVERLRPEDLNVFLDFFDSRAFSDNPDWAFCYCHCFYADHCAMPWKSRTAEENRLATAQRIRSGRLEGYLAFDGEVVVGWCGAGPMENIPIYAGDAEPDKSTIGVITCFLVAPEKRGQGIARALLREACRDFGERGLRIAEGNPRLLASSASENHFGPLSLFLSEGFTIDRTDPEDGSIYVRKPLGSTSPAA